MTKLDATNPIDDSFIDRLVDGELTPGELRAAIDRLDQEPDGWKRCGLAFLEAQCWRESFRAMGQPAAPPAECPPLSFSSAIPPRLSVRRRWLHGSIAAGLAAASFAIGWVGHGARSLSSVSRPLIVSTGAKPDRSDSGPQAESRNQAVVDFRQPTGLAARPARPNQSPPTVKELVRWVGRLRIGDKSNGTEVPILAGPGITEQWLRNQPPAVSEYREAALQRQGYRVDQRRQLITTPLADGRRVTVPVDLVQIRHTGNTPL